MRDHREILVRPSMGPMPVRLYSGPGAVVAPGRVAALRQMLGASDDDDALSVLADYYHQHGGQISQLLRSPETDAEFSDWQS